MFCNLNKFRINYVLCKRNLTKINKPNAVILLRHNTMCVYEYIHFLLRVRGIKALDSGYWKIQITN